MSLRIPIVLDPYCPGSILSWIPYVLVPFCRGSLLSLWFPIVPMVPYCPYGSLLSWIHLVLDPSCPGSLLSWFHFVLDPFCPGSILSSLVRSERSALTRKYRTRTWALEWHCQRTTFPANRTKIGKNWNENCNKNQKLKILGRGWSKLTFD